MLRHPGLWWRRLRHLVVVGVLMVFLFVLESIIGCEPDEDPQVLYGPPPADDGQEGDDGLDLDAVVYYGPQPFDTVDEMQVLYGPQPVDVVDVVDVEPQDVSMDVPQTWYGPPPGFDTVEPVDTIPEKDLADDVKKDQVQMYYGPQPLYGPQPGE